MMIEQTLRDLAENISGVANASFKAGYDAGMRDAAKKTLVTVKEMFESTINASAFRSVNNESMPAEEKQAS